MTEATSTLAKLLFVEDVQEDTRGATLTFQDGVEGRLAKSDTDYTTNLRLARRSQQRGHPVAVSFDKGQTIAALLRADNDVPTKVWDENDDGARVLFQGHDGVFRLKRDHPDLDRLRKLLDDAIAQKSIVWFATQRDLALLDAVAVG